MNADIQCAAGIRQPTKGVNGFGASTREKQLSADFAD